jgi:hypothetical protein
MNALALPLVLAAAGVVAASTPARADDDTHFHHYRLVDLPATEAGCAAEATSLGARIAAQTGVEIFAARCQQDWGASYYVDVTYVADAPLNVVSTVNGDDDVYHQGLYRNAEACTADLASQTERFRRATGIEPLVAYCSDERSSSDHSIALTIEGFGTPGRAPRFFARQIFGSIQGDRDAIAAHMAERLGATRGADVFGAVLASETMESRFALSYYGDADLRLTDHGDFAFAASETCDAMRERFEGILSTAGEEVVGSFCARRDVSSTTELHVVSLVDHGDLVTDIAPVDYASRRECRAQIDATVAVYRDQYHRDVFDAECAIVGGRDYYVVVFSHGS